MAADSAVGVASMPIRWMGDIVVSGSLPELGGTATAYGFKGAVSAGAVAWAKTSAPTANVARLPVTKLAAAHLRT